MSHGKRPEPLCAGPTPGESTVPHWLVGGGAMGRLIRATDWTGTALGPMSGWPSSLRTAVNLALNSNFPIDIVWGPRHTQLYNDGYWPICADKHPRSMGQDFTECWASAFPVIGDAFRSALAGTTAYLEDQRLFVDRLGYLEEAFFTFSFSPIYDEDGQVAGLFHPVIETTGRMLAQRRTRCLRDVAEAGTRAHSLEEGLTVAAQALDAFGFDLPFVLFYVPEPEGGGARLVACAGLEPGLPASPRHLDLARARAAEGWPLDAALASGRALEVGDVARRFPGLRAAAYPEPVRTAFVRPIGATDEGRPDGLMIAAASPRLPLGDDYRAFFDLLASTLGTVTASAAAREAERRRAEKLAEIDRAKTLFFSNVSHEFRTPLTLILAPLEDELAQPDASPAGDARRQRLALVHRNGLRLLKLVNALLDFARIEAGRMQAQFAPTDLAALTSELAANFRAACEQAGVALEVDCPSLPEPVFVDGGLWEKIVLNLVSNAFKFTLAGRIAVRLRARGPVAQLTVEDTGGGIPAAELPRLFERFHRVPGSVGRSQEGSGIGLALVHELVKLHGGSIRVDSRVGQGSTFTVAIPFGREHLLDAAVVTTPVAAPAGSAVRMFVDEAHHWLPHATELPVRAGVSPRPHLVWADDNADMRDYVARLLAERYDVVAVGDGEAALAAIRRDLPGRLPDLVLSDVMMPRLDGFGLLRALRADERTRDLPVILLSARAGEEARIEGLEAGADDYLVKPFTARELLAKVSSQITLARTRQEVEAARRAVHDAAQLRASEERLRFVTDAAEVGTWDWELEHGRLAWSARCKAILGLSPDTAESYETFLAAVHPDDRVRTDRNVRQALAGTGGLAIDHRVVWPDGSEHWLHARGRTTFAEDGRPLRMGGVLVDITPRIHATQEIRRLNATLEARVAERTAELQAANRELDAFTYAVAHDLRGPLRGLTGFTRALVEDCGDELGAQARDDLDEIVDATREMGELVEGLLRLSRSTRGELVRESVDVTGMARDIRRELERRAPARRVEWQIEEGLSARADATMLRAALWNLLDNAWKYSGSTAAARIRVDAQVVDGSRWYRVSDNGAGFDMRYAAHLFQPFQRLHRNDEFPGIGIGLATVQRIVHRHGGRIEAQSTPGQGATFRFTLEGGEGTIREASAEEIV